MAGSYQVEFDFEETTPLTPGYEPHPPSKTGATELVLVLANASDGVSLQHVLVVGSGGTGKDGNVVKHWRQDWTFQDPELLEFQGKRTWQRRPIPDDAARCTWTQAVFEVDDSPRYEGYGRWAHDSSGSLWESNQTWRPLPRREYTKRSDYDVLVGVNRHRITKAGWEHAQDNVKLVLEPRHSLVRERGLNRYTRIDAASTEPAASYWRATAGFWKEVREEWGSVLLAHPHLNLRAEVDGKRLYEHLFYRASPQSTEAAASSGRSESIHELIVRYVVATPAAHGAPSASSDVQEPNQTLQGSPTTSAGSTSRVKGTP